MSNLRLMWMIGVFILCVLVVWSLGRITFLGISLGFTAPLDRVDTRNVDRTTECYPQSQKVFYGILTSASRRDKRDVFRTLMIKHVNVDYRFIMGYESSGVSRLMQLENRTYGDIVILNIKENMNNGKTHAYFTWALLELPCYKMYFKGDDDFSVNMCQLHSSISNITDLNVYWGYHVVRQFDPLIFHDYLGAWWYNHRLDTSWYWIAYNRYMAGMCYGVGREILVKLIQSHYTEVWGPEDMRMGFWMHNLNATYVDESDKLRNISPNNDIASDVIGIHGGKSLKLLIRNFEIINSAPCKP